MADAPHSGARARGDESTLSAPTERRAEPASDGHYLIVFDASSAALFQLPRSGEVVIGRSGSVDLRLQDVSVSRRHTSLRCTDGQAEVADLESQNGTFVNGERLAATRKLHSGDIITLCSATLVYHCHARAPGRRSLLALDQLRERLDEELERSRRYGRPFTLVVAELPEGPDRGQAARVWVESMRSIDIAASGEDRLLALWPEVDHEAAPAAAAHTLAMLTSVAPGIRLGHASWPRDGCDAATLWTAARSAAQSAPPGVAAAGRLAFQSRRIGEHELILADPAMQRVYALIDRLAVSDLPVLIGGETGTGKELAAAALHHGSPRQGAMVVVNCAALPEALVESELFGHDKGAFTGASHAKPGRFEAARGGTLFLDEIGELSAAAQAKLLRVLETKRVVRLGEVHEREIEVRVVAATNRRLADDVKAGRFRQDLFFRLGAATLWLPPLRDRTRELPILAQHFLSAAAARAGRDMTISDEAMRELAGYPWPGNVRELKNCMDYIAAAFTEPVLEPGHLIGALGGARLAEDIPRPPSPPSAGDTSGFRPIEEELQELERTRMAQALARSNGNQTQAARLIGMPLRTFQAKVKQFGLSRPR